jgi:hypothetical protein
MSEAFTGELIGVDDASKVLDDMIAQDAQAAGKPADGADKSKDNEQGEGEEGAQNSAGSDKAEQGEAGGSKVEDGKAADAKAKAADEGKAGDEATKAAEAAKAEPQGSRYEKAKGRLNGSWDELNATKATFQAERETWTKQREAEKAALDQERAEFEAERDKAEKQFTPEEYEQAAAKFEKAGKFDLADEAKAMAAKLRKNPPVKRADRMAGQRKEWAMKAGQEFPDIMKDNSPLQVRVAQIMKAEPDLERHPKGIYLAARIAQLEAKAGESQALTTKVAESDKALKTAQARIKELEQLSAPGDGQANNRLPGRKNFEQMSDTEQFQELERQAQEVGALTR